MSAVIRRARSAADRLECNSLQVAVFSNGEHRDPNKDHWWLALVHDQPAGFACLRVMDSKIAYLALAGVLPKYRGRGIQKRLIKLRENYARALGCKVMITYVAWANWPSANSLIRAGYKIYTPAGKPWGLKYSLYFQKDL